MRTSHPLRAAVLILSAVAVLGVPAWAAFAPIASDSREAVYEIPKGTFARRQAGEKFDLIPAEIRLTLGVKDVLVMKNQDDVPHGFHVSLHLSAAHERHADDRGRARAGTRLDATALAHDGAARLGVLIVPG